MNALQEFMARGNVQIATPGNGQNAIATEKIQLDGTLYDATFGDAIMMPVMTQQGYQDHLVTPVKVSRVQFPSDPKAHQSLIRVSVEREMFIQMVDISNPVVYTFVVTDRRL